MKLRWPRFLHALRPTSAALPSRADADKPLVIWHETWDVETARLAYEHARETHRVVEATADVLDRKVVAVFGISSVIATLAPVLSRFTPGTLSWGLVLGAAGAWLLSTIQSWQAFKPRDYRTDPNPRDLATPEWLKLKPGPYYLARLHHVAQTVDVNRTANAKRAAALRRAFGWALLEVGILLAALIAR